MTTGTPRAVARAAVEMGESLGRWRRLRELTLAETADRAGVGVATLRRIEQGRGGTIESLLRVARALGGARPAHRVRRPADDRRRTTPCRRGAAGSRPSSAAVVSGPPVRVWVSDRGTDVDAGTLYTHRRGRTESATFVYTSSFVARPGAYELDPTLPPSAAPTQTPVGTRLFGALSDCAPDRWGRTLVSRAEAPAREVAAMAPAFAALDTVPHTLSG